MPTDSTATEPWTCQYCENGVCNRCTHVSSALVDDEPEECACTHPAPPRSAVQTVTVPSPTFTFPGPEDTTEKTLRTAVSNLRRGYPIGGSNVAEGIARLLRVRG